MFSSGTDPMLNEKIIFDEKINYTISDLKTELLDKVKSSNNIVYNIYTNINKSTNKEEITQNKFSFNMITIKPGLIGREHNKTLSMQLIKPILVQIIYGDGFVIMEDSNNLKVVKVSKGSYVYIPKNYSFVFVNKNENSYMSIMLVKCLDTNFQFNLLKAQNGSSLFYLNLGFKRNMNSKLTNKLEEYDTHYLPNIELDTKLDIYEQVTSNLEKFEFLNRF